MAEAEASFSESTKRILLLAVPAALALVTQGAINQVDMLFIGHLGGSWDPMYSGVDISDAARNELATKIKDGQAAIGISMKLLWLYAGFLSSLAIGTQAMVARRFGEGDRPMAGAVALNSIAAAFISSVFVTVVAIVLLPACFEMISAGALGVIEQGVLYARIRLLAIGVIVMTASVRSFFDGIGRTYIFMWVAIFMNTLNVVLDYGLVFGAWGLPRMEVEGAAWASAISAAIGLVVLFGWLFLKDYKGYQVFHWKRLRIKMMWRVVTFSLPNGIATALMTLGFLAFDKVIAMIDEVRVERALTEAGYVVSNLSMTARTEIMDQLGTGTALFQSIHQVVIAVMMLFFMTGFGFGSAASTLVSHELGAGLLRGARRIGWRTVLVGGVIVSLFGVLLAIFPAQVAAIFNPQDPAFQAAAVAPLRLVGLCAFLPAGALIFSQALYSAGMPVFVAVVTTVGIVWLVPGSYLLGITFDFGLFGAWIAAIGFTLILFVAMGLMWVSDRWKKIDI
ncbi:MAG: hypothetical protein CMH55_09350 [Myxococcales bacterium]|nr:hypothetical protein [Myxococcales bacterium]